MTYIEARLIIIKNANVSFEESNRNGGAVQIKTIDFLNHRFPLF